MIRGVGLRSAVAINVATMVGAGPFITLPLVVAALHGSVSAAAWVAGAVIAACDGLVWAELASRYPRSGGTYVYLREAFGPHGPGRFVAFLFVWQFLFWAPLILASGYIGFAQYAAYLVPAVSSPVATHALAAGVGVVTLAALYRPIPAIARTALVLGGVALVTLLAVAFAGITHPYAPLARTLPGTLTFGAGIGALGSALIITLYDYSGYADVCALGDEVIAPARTIPRAIVFSVLFVGVAYILLNLGVAAAVAPADIEHATTIASTVAERAFGTPFAVAVTLAVMLTAFASTYGLLLAASRVPYAAALEGDFLAPFAKLHRSGRFPAVSLVTIGLLALPASLLPLDAVIAALTAGIVLVQGAGQIVALALARAARRDAPFRVPLYPLPPLIALAGWLFLFASTGAVPIAFGLGTLAVGAAVYLVRARLTRLWPFAAGAVTLLLMAALRPVPSAAQGVTSPPAFGHATVARTASGDAYLRVDGKPFFFLGGAFFYERMPRDAWWNAMHVMRDLGANTLDLYVPWNWHEIADGDFDFTGRTSPRRDLREVLRLGKQLGFRFIVRPGPVIRNEWRNGGYPAWLLQRPEYGMPLHDVLEGRYPATATLQNAHSDAAAAQWMRNASHRYYAARWLHRALAEFRPVADRVLAVQLDDDQGAYLDNDTYPAPHLHAYLHVAARAGSRRRRAADARVHQHVRDEGAVVVAGVGDGQLVSERRVHHRRARPRRARLRDRDAAHAARGAARVQRVPSRVARRSGRSAAAAGRSVEHVAGDRRARGLGSQRTRRLPARRTRSRRSVGRRPSRTRSTRGTPPSVVDGGEAIWPAPDDTFNRFYTTRRMFGALALYGPAFAEARRMSTVALAYDGRGDAFAAAAALKTQLALCRARGIACDVVDPLAVDDARLRTFRYVVVPRGTFAALARRARAAGARVVPAVQEIAGIPALPNLTLLDGPHGAFAVVENWTSAPLRVDLRRAGAGFAGVPSFVMPARDARIVAANLDLHFVDNRYAAGDRLTTSCAFNSRSDEGVPSFTAGQPAQGGGMPARCDVIAVLGGKASSTAVDGRAIAALGERTATVLGHTASVDRVFPDVPVTAITLAPNGGVPGAVTPAADITSGASVATVDAFRDGMPAVELRNAHLRAVVVPDGGARVVALGPNRSTGFLTYGDNAFDATGALRDDVLVQLPPSPTDRIAKYTHTYPAGMFNRPYAACTFTHVAGDGNVTGAGAYLAYDAPDVVPHGARFERVLALGASSDRLVADLRFTPHEPAPRQRFVSYSAIAARGETLDDGGGPHPSDRPAVLDPKRGVVLFAAAPATQPEFPRFDERYPEPGSRAVVTVAWRPDDVEAISWQPARSNGTLRLVFRPGDWKRLTFATWRIPPGGSAAAFAEAERAWLDANPAPANESGEVAKRYTQSPQKRPSESSCGFDSHLPQ